MHATSRFTIALFAIVSSTIALPIEVPSMSSPHVHRDLYEKAAALGAKFGFMSEKSFNKLGHAMVDGAADFDMSKLSGAYKFANRFDYMQPFRIVFRRVEDKIATGRANTITKLEANIVLTMAKDGDNVALDIVKQIPVNIQKQSDVWEYLHRVPKSPSSVAKKVVVGGTVVGGTALVGGIVLSQLPASRDDVDKANLAAPVPNGRLSEEDQKTLLYYIQQHPEEYNRVMQQIVNTEAITQAEIQLFQSINPGSSSSQKAVRAFTSDPANTSKSLLDLD